MKIGQVKKTCSLFKKEMEALVRIAKSNARLRLSEEVAVEDADKAIKLFRTSLKQLGLAGVIFLCFPFFLLFLARW